MKSMLEELDFSAPPSSTGGLMLTVHTNNLRAALVAALRVIDTMNADGVMRYAKAVEALETALEPFKVVGAAETELNSEIQSNNRS